LLIASLPTFSLLWQAAASGQPNVAFANEDKNVADSSREDVRCLINGHPKAPQEAKAKYATANSSSNGIDRNKAGLSKVTEIRLYLRCLSLLLVV
jgi:hypothetical protein